MAFRPPSPPGPQPASTLLTALVCPETAVLLQGPRGLLAAPPWRLPLSRLQRRRLPLRLAFRAPSGPRAVWLLGPRGPGPLPLPMFRGWPRNLQYTRPCGRGPRSPWRRHVLLPLRPLAAGAALVRLPALPPRCCQGYHSRVRLPLCLPTPRCGPSPNRPPLRRTDGRGHPLPPVGMRLGLSLLGLVPLSRLLAPAPRAAFGHILGSRLRGPAARRAAATAPATTCLTRSIIGAGGIRRPSRSVPSDAVAGRGGAVVATPQGLPAHPARLARYVRA